MAASTGGGRRLRAVHPVVDGDGRCTLLYDLERTFVIEVPGELQTGVAPAIASGVLDERPRTGSTTTISGPSMRVRIGRQRTRAPARRHRRVVRHVGRLQHGLRLLLRGCDQFPIGPMSDETAQAALDFVFEKTKAAKRIALHFGSGEPRCGSTCCGALLRKRDSARKTSASRSSTTSPPTQRW
jgi:hypothetical protein